MEPFENNKLALLGAKPKVKIRANKSGSWGFHGRSDPSSLDWRRDTASKTLIREEESVNPGDQTTMNDSSRQLTYDTTKQPSEDIRNNFSRVPFKPNRPVSVSTEEQNDNWRESCRNREQSRTPHARLTQLSRINSRCNSKKDRTDSKPASTIMSYRCLVELVEERNSEILFILVLPESGFFQLIAHPESKNYTVMPYILLAIGKAITSSNSATVASLVNSIHATQTFMYCSVSSYLVAFGTFTLDSRHLQSLASLLDLLDYFQKYRPASTFEMCSLLVVQLKIACQLLSDKWESKEEVDNIRKRILDLDTKKKQYGHGKNVNEIKQESKMEQMQFEQPPGSFRWIPVLPQISDIKDNNPFIRPNIKKGQYLDAGHYLDVQFRLLREDYIRPLRESIATYVETKRNMNPLPSKPGFKLYESVYIYDYEITIRGIFHTAHFDVKKFKGVDWENSKRLLCGSLLCLSQDDFETFFFVTVAKREAKDLKNGFLTLQFEEITGEVLQITPKQKFTIIETDAFFEAFRHTLSSLSQMDMQTFPLKEYLIEMKTEVKSPQYLEISDKYDLGCLLADQHSDSEKREKRIINILDESQWPTGLELKLDESQYKALKSAVTKEFIIIIQGPPGTGKTFIGLRIVQLILENIHSFREGPIVVVCYTNHALDQFLEGMLPFTNHIVRMGGRCSNEAVLGPYTLQNKRRSSVTDKSLLKRRNRQTFILEWQVQKLKNVKAVVKVLPDDIFKLEMMKCVIEEEHYDTLINYNPMYDYRARYVFSHFLELEMSENGTNESFRSHSNYEKIERILSLAFDSYRLYYYYDGSQDEDEDEDDMQYVEYMTAKAEKKKFSGDDSVPEQSVLLNINLASNAEVRRNLKNSNAMTEREVSRVKNVWGLDIDDRWRLYKYWVNQFKIFIHQKIEQQERILRLNHEEYKDIHNEMDLDVLRTARIVGMTTTGAAKYRSIVEQLKSKIVVVEEAAEILEAHVITSLTKDTEHLILIGDHQQLRPNPMVYELAVKFNLNISLFERMINNGMEYHQLTIQHRMRPCIASLLVPHIYPSLIDHDSVLEYEPIRGVTKSMFFFNHKVLETDVHDSSSLKNEYEAKFLVKLCEYLLHQGYKKSQITILTTYTGQLLQLTKLAKNRIDGVRITVVDNFQGEENDIILISFVRSNLEKRIGFLKTPNRVCVALSRAKKGLYCIGNFQFFAEQCELWKNIVQSLEKEEAVGPTLTFVCQIHKIETKVTIPTDFDMVPSGGCGQLCEFRHLCGHACVQHCHGYDLLHEKMKCFKPCARTCSAGHKCPKICYEDCGNCEVIVSKLLPKCQHTVPVPCHLPVEEFPCPLPCECKFPCDHPCVKKCHEECGKCMVPVQKSLPKCQHTLPVPCHLPAEEFKCPLPCERKFPCEHPCVKKCHEECGKCIVTVQKLLPKCQHTLDVPCCVPVEEFSCTLQCETTLLCGHKCGSLCGRDCLQYKCQIQVPTILKCSHEMILLCFQTKDKDNFLSVCKQPCAVKLPNCNHACDGTCGNCYTIKWHDEVNGKVISTALSRLLQNNKYISKLPCEKQLACGHICSLKCGKICLAVQCKKEVNVTLKCGHDFQQKCHQQTVTVETLCDKVCGANLLCGHICSEPFKKCTLTKRHEEGNTAHTSLCKVPVMKFLPQCNHEVSVPCNEPSDKFPCSNPCQKILPCGHQCGLLCRENCSKNVCKEIVIANLRCGHSTSMSCFQSSNPDAILKHCRNPCTSKLNCGHECSGTCSRCYQGRLHQDCLEKCRKTLICGHVCESACSKPCPPCKKPCKRQCPHKKCSHVCSKPCKICDMPCEKSCEHAVCTSLCWQLCSREPCNEPCTKKLKCNHECMGFCGDPCPQICQVCDQEKVVNLLQSTTNEDDARFIQLEECEHIVDVSGIKLLIQAATSNEIIGPILCPNCGVPIRSDSRFESVVKAWLNQVEIVKQNVLELEETGTTIKVIAVKNRARNLSKKDFETLLFTLTSRLERERLSFNQINEFENALNLAEVFSKSFPAYYSKFVFEFYFIFDNKKCSLPGSIVSHMRRLKVFTMQTYEMIANFIRYQYDKRSERAVENVSWELQRFKHQCKLLDFVSKKQYSETLKSVFETSAVQQVCAQMVDTLCKFQTFCSADETLLKELFQCFSDLLGVTVPYKCLPKVEVLKAVNMSAGYWYTCPNTHVYYYNNDFGIRKHAGSKCPYCAM